MTNTRFVSLDIEIVALKADRMTKEEKRNILKNNDKFKDFGTRNTQPKSNAAAASEESKTE